MKSLRRLSAYLRRRRGIYAAGLSILALATIVNAAIPLVIKQAIDALRVGDPTHLLGPCALLIIGLAIVRGFLVFFGRNLILTTARRIEYELRNDIYRHLLRLPISFYDAHASGDITSRFINDLEAVRMMVGIGLISIVATGLMFLASMTGMFIIDWKLALASLVPLSVVSIITAITGHAMHAQSMHIQDRLGAISAFAQENFNGARVVRAFAQEEHAIAGFSAECTTYLHANMKFARLRGTAYALMSFFTQLAIAVTLWVGGRGLMLGTFSEGDFAAFTAYQFMLVWPMIAIGWTLTIVQRGIACMDRIIELLDTPPVLRRTDSPNVNFSGRIEIRDLTFQYDKNRDAALRHVSLVIEPGSRVAIVGPTGAGKSTLAALLTRLYPAPSGTVFIDGHNVNTISPELQRRTIGCVPQDSFLFSDTLRANILFGAPEASDGHIDVERAATLSRIAQDAERFPDRLDQLIGERGVTLSGGQKQRTAIARAIVREPAILLLDDALSSVDAQTEHEILNDLEGVMRGRTTLIITHRLASARHADRVYVLDRGKIVESGTHDELKKGPGLYARMWARQQFLSTIGANGNEGSPPRTASIEENPPTLRVESE